MSAPTAEIFKETSSISGFYLGSPFFLMQPHKPAEYLFLTVFDRLRYCFFTLVFLKETRLESFEIWNLFASL